MWNEVLARVGDRRRRHPILYLAGPADIDRDIAMQKGVLGQNLIAIDKYPANVEAIRRRGYPSIRGRIEDVLRAWPDDWPVSAVLLDYCSGLEPTVLVALEAMLFRRPFSGTEVVINLQRGRDASTNSHRARVGQVLLSRDKNPKHRGLIVAYSLMEMLCNLRLANGDLPDASTALRRVECLYRSLNWRTFEYRSETRQTYDSLVLTVPPEITATSAWSCVGPVKLRNEIRALRAVRTRRLNETPSMFALSQASR